MKVFSFFCFAAALLQAQPTLTLAQAISEAVTAHPDLAVADARIAAARGARVQAALSPNPRLFLQSENTRFWGSPAFSYPKETDNFLYLSQVFERSGKRERRTEAAEAAVRRTEAERDLTTRRIAAEVGAAYWAASSAQAIARLLSQDAVMFETVVQYHRDRVREGAMAELDLMRILLERDRLLVAVRSAEQAARRAVIALQGAIGRRQFTSVTLSDIPPFASELPAPDLSSVLQSRLEVTVAQQEIEEARARLRLEQANARQDPEALFGYKRSNGFDTLIAGYQINLPVRNRNQGRIASATAEVRQAERQAGAVEARIAAEVAIARSEAENRRRLLDEVLAPMRDRALEISRIAQAAYREGGTDLLRLIDSERSRLEALTAYYRALAEYQQAITTLYIVTGAPL